MKKKPSDLVSAMLPDLIDPRARKDRRKAVKVVARRSANSDFRLDPQDVKREVAEIIAHALVSALASNR